MVLPALLSTPDRRAERRGSRALGLHGARGHLRPRPLGRPRPPTSRRSALPAARGARSPESPARAPPLPGSQAPVPPRRPSRLRTRVCWRAPAWRGLGRLRRRRRRHNLAHLNGPGAAGGRAGSDRGCVKADRALRAAGAAGPGCTRPVLSGRGRPEGRPAGGPARPRTDAPRLRELLVGARCWSLGLPVGWRAGFRVGIREGARPLPRQACGCEPAAPVGAGHQWGPLCTHRA